MKNKVKPLPLDVDAITPQQQPRQLLPSFVNAKYANLLLPIDAYEQAPSIDDPFQDPRFTSGARVEKSVAGVAGLHALQGDTIVQPTGHKEEFQEGDCVYLRSHGNIFTEDDGRFLWKSKMTRCMKDAVAGEIKVLDTDSILVTFARGEVWLPTCTVDPCMDDNGYLTDGKGYVKHLQAGMLVSLRKDAKSVISTSPYTWENWLGLPGLGLGTVTEVLRNSRGCCRAQFGGFLWSLPLSALTSIKDKEENREAESYLIAYGEACARHNCKPNSELLRLLTNTPVTRIDLSHNYLGKKGLLCLEAVLCINNSITHLSLPNNALCHDSVRGVLDVLRKDTLIRSVDFSGNQFSYLTGRGIKQLVSTNPNIVSVRLESTGIPDWMVKDIAEQTAKNFEILRK
eukprot:TRINITY_DN864_c2_g1_i1.p1 TRINITY_DN864_c2_g1~~TRINITY_DN864_c2_g1_i1.p1  ORF type:complete len:399 (+),score=27.51 TRINITY_DN864_c2_g1_i1:280-1476(+)